ncbi:MAG: hypothetical protein HC896_07690 [Bacteroidales bacterium]|nr:hypothetical protein [Bacteroidales bacterium]
MNRWFLSFIVFSLAININLAQENKNLADDNELIEDNTSESLLYVNASQYGIGYRETQVLLQNRMGVRIEYTLDRSNLQLWISPPSGKIYVLCRL